MLFILSPFLAFQIDDAGLHGFTNILIVLHSNQLELDINIMIPIAGIGGGRVDIFVYLLGPAEGCQVGIIITTAAAFSGELIDSNWPVSGLKLQIECQFWFFAVRLFSSEHFHLHFLHVDIIPIRPGCLGPTRLNTTNIRMRSVSSRKGALHRICSQEKGSFAVAEFFSAANKSTTKPGNPVLNDKTRPGIRYIVQESGSQIRPMIGNLEAILAASPGNQSVWCYQFSVGYGKPTPGCCWQPGGNGSMFDFGFPVHQMANAVAPVYESR